MLVQSSQWTHVFCWVKPTFSIHLIGPYPWFLAFLRGLRPLSKCSNRCQRGVEWADSNVRSSIMQYLDTGYKLLHVATWYKDPAMWKPELKWHQMTICWYVLGNQKGQIFQWWRICLILYMVFVRLCFWVLFRLANQCKFWLEVWRKDSVVSQTFLESGSNDCRYVDMPTHLVGIWKIESFGSNH